MRLINLKKFKLTWSYVINYCLFYKYSLNFYSLSNWTTELRNYKCVNAMSPSYIYTRYLLLFCNLIQDCKFCTRDLLMSSTFDLLVSNAFMPNSRTQPAIWCQARAINMYICMYIKGFLCWEALVKVFLAIIARWLLKVGMFNNHIYSASLRFCRGLRFWHKYHSKCWKSRTQVRTQS